MEATYLFYGFASEYVLHNIYKEMKKQGFNCLEIDALQIKNSKKIIDSLKDKRVIFITSAHLLLDKINFTDFYPNDNEFYSVLEIIKILRPIKKIYIPHDLTQPLIQYEETYLQFFDYFLSPCEPFTSIYSQYCKTEEVGWIKYQPDQNKTKKPTNRAIWLLSDYILHYKMGVEKSFNLIRPILEQGVAIKFPKWIGSDEFEKYYRKKGINVYSASSNTIELILDHQIIITNGLSSTIAESYFLGKTVVNIMENSHYGNYLGYLQELFPNLLYFEKIKDFDIKKINKQNNPNILKPFDIEKTINLISFN